MAKKTKTKNKTETHEIKSTSVPMWRAIAADLLSEPGDTNDWHIGEVATALQLFGGLIQRNWKDISKYAERHDTVKLRMAFHLDRKDTPPMIKIRIAGAVEGIDDVAEAEVPDASQTELPGMEEPANETQAGI